MQISGLNESLQFGADDVLAIEINGVTYKLTGATLATTLKTLGNYLATTGGTMSGDIIFKTNLNLSNPTTTSDEIVSVVDKNNAKMALIRVDTNADGREVFQLGAARDINGTRIYSLIRCGVRANGDAFYEVSDVNAFREAIGLGLTRIDGATGTTDANGNVEITGYTGTAPRIVLFGWDGSHIFIPFYYASKWYFRVQLTNAAGQAFANQSVTYSYDYIK